ncbi:MAG: thioredoxin family protein [Bacteroidota bacterium]
MAATPSTMLALGTKAPAFDLPDYLGNIHSFQLGEGQNPLLIAFICNHCPFVVHIMPQFAALARDCASRGIRVIAISSNDVEHYPQDAPDKMQNFAQAYQLDIPYLYDETQEIAKAYHAACTPDFYLFNANHELVYRGQFDDSRPGNTTPVTGKDLARAIDVLMNEGSIITTQKPSIGCNIKWKPGNAPHYYG